MALFREKVARGEAERAATRASDPLGAIAKAAAAGDPDALGTLFISVGPAILRAVRGVLGARHPDLEDVAQEAVLGLTRALPNFRHDCAVVHFAGRVAVLTALAARRRMRVRSVEGMRLVEADDEPSTAASPAQLAAASRRRETLRSLCEELPEPQAEALMMMCIMGLTVEEIADTTGVAVNTVWSRLRLAKTALRTKVRSDPSLLAALEIDL